MQANFFFFFVTLLYAFAAAVDCLPFYYEMDLSFLVLDLPSLLSLLWSDGAGSLPVSQLKLKTTN